MWWGAGDKKKHTTSYPSSCCSFFSTCSFFFLISSLPSEDKHWQNKNHALCCVSYQRVSGPLEKSARIYCEEKQCCKNELKKKVYTFSKIKLKYEETWWYCWEKAATFPNVSQWKKVRFLRINMSKHLYIFGKNASKVIILRENSSYF